MFLAFELFTIMAFWWSQRDVNPCLSLKRTDESEEKQQDDIEESSNE